jgi:uncharacterized protein
MDYNYQEIRDEVKKISREACFAPENQFTSTVWHYHIIPVVEHSMKLGKKLKADLEVLELAAYLHDLAALLDAKMYKNHHVHGADLADEILARLEFPRFKINRIKSCILSHRGSVRRPRRTKEAKILASADAMAHITETVDIYYLTFGVHKYKTLEGARWMKGKFERSWKKIIPEGRKMVKRDYSVAIKQLDKAIVRADNNF